MEKFRRKIWLALCITCWMQLSGQDIAFHKLSIENGLPSNSILAISQDNTGYMWFGSNNGLSRFDGIRFKTYKSIARDSTALSSNDIHSLLRDSKNRLWIGTSNGLDLYNAKKDNFRRFDISNGEALIINSILEDRRGQIWIGSSRGLHLLSDPDGSTFLSFYESGKDAGIAGNIVKAIFEDYVGNIWVGTNNGLTRMQWQQDKYNFKTFCHSDSIPGSLSANYITCITEDQQHRLWIGTQNDGINLLASGQDQFIRLAHSKETGALINNNIRCIVPYTKGGMWVGTQEGLSIINPSTLSVSSYQHNAADKNSLSQNSIYSIFEDANGSMWTGTYYGGANISYAFTTPFEIIQNDATRNSLSNNVASSIVEDGQHNIWIGTEGGGLNYYDRKQKVFTAFKNNLKEEASIGSNLVKVVYLDKDGNPWIGTHGGGLNVLDRKSNQFIRHLYKPNDLATLNSEISAIQEDAADRFWVFSNNGLRLFRRRGTRLLPLSISEEFPHFPPMAIRCFFLDSKKRFWIGADPGLFRVEGNSIISVDSNFTVNCIAEDSSGRIWTGLGYEGIAGLDMKAGKLIRYQDKENPQNVNVLGVLPDEEDNIWMSTDRGIIKFNPRKNTFQTYTVSDGLSGNEFNYKSFLKDSRGEMFFGGFNGITHFFPHRIQFNPYVAPLVLTGLKLFNNTIDPNSADKLLKENISYANTVRFHYDQNVFSIEFALLNYIKSSKNKYAYKLVGFDKEWNASPGPSVTYTNLPPGNYLFAVKGANNDGIWSLPAYINIHVLPPYWLTWWAYAIYFIAFAALVFLVTRYFFLRNLFKKEEELHQIKLNFFTNISHEIRTHLTLIMTPVEQIMRQKEDASFEYQQLKQVKANANRLLRLVNELLDFRKAETRNLQLKPERHNLIPFLQEIYTSFRDISLSRNIRTSFIHSSENIFLYFDRAQLEKVFFNLLMNAFKFTPAGGRIILQVEEKNNRVKISVTDNGHGIASEYLDKLFSNFFQVADHGVQNTGYGIGLALTKHIVELHKGSIEVESIPQKDGKEGKTIFTVTIPQGNKHFDETALQQIERTDKADDLFATERMMAPPATNQEVQGINSQEKNFNILLIEDNEELRKLLWQSFNAQYEVILAENGKVGWETAIEKIPDLIVSDVMMPEMDGFTLCAQLKQDERTSHIPVILLTAMSAQNEQISGLETGADVYITKPFSVKALELNVRNLLAARERMRARFSLQLNGQPVPGRKKEAALEENMSTRLDREFMGKLLLLVDEHMDDPGFGVDMLSRKMAMSAPILYRKLKALTGLSVNEFVKSLRLQKAATLLMERQHTVNEVSFMVGYNDRKYFSREFKKQFGQTPTEYVEVNGTSDK